MIQPSEAATGQSIGDTVARLLVRSTAVLVERVIEGGQPYVRITDMLCGSICHLSLPDNVSEALDKAS